MPICAPARVSASPGNTLDNDNAQPRACVQFSEKLLKSGVDYATFVTVNNAAAKGVDAKDNQICVEGLEFGQHYRIRCAPACPLPSMKACSRRSMSMSM